MTPDYWTKAKTTLSRRDPVLKAIIKAYHGEALQLRGEGFRTLARAIVGQQISVKAADSVWKKFEAAASSYPPACGGTKGGDGAAKAIPKSSITPTTRLRVSQAQNPSLVASPASGRGKSGITPENIAGMGAGTLRACGLSDRKVIYMHALANHFLENKKTIKNWPNMADDEIIAELTSIHGIGRWTAEMFLIFALGRPDVFPLDDLGLLKGIYRHYNKGEKLSKSEVIAIGERWRPYRSLGTWYMWRVLDPVPVEY